jgi:hypothetical protein
MKSPGPFAAHDTEFIGNSSLLARVLVEERDYLSTRRLIRRVFLLLLHFVPKEVIYRLRQKSLQWGMH